MEVRSHLQQDHPDDLHMMLVQWEGSNYKRIYYKKIIKGSGHV